MERESYEVNDRHLENEEEATAFREKWDVETTPQTFIGGELIGTLDDMREYFGKTVPNQDGTTYRPVVTLFAITFLMALGAAWVGSILTWTEHDVALLVQR